MRVKACSTVPSRCPLADNCMASSEMNFIQSGQLEGLEYDVRMRYPSYNRGKISCRYFKEQYLTGEA